MKSWEHDEMNREEGIKIGQTLGLQQGMEAMISTCQDFGHSYEETRLKVKEKFSFTLQEADEYMKKYWK